ncbi:helix-turn-helix domain-containing protein [uncultured Enterovirga sp.]|uniref:helix-turn-helix domain-containing protein n=1 Tax=uncultured Enterovirga sp. TaxID=2026352 RepID=UPI0035CC2A7E
MSIAAQTWAVQQRCGSATLKAVLMAVARFADDDGLAWPSQRLLSEHTELDQKTVRSALKTLSEKGVIFREPFTREDGSRGADRIQLSLLQSGSEQNHGPVPTGSGGTGTASGGTGVRPGGVGAYSPGGTGGAPGQELSLELSKEISPSIEAPAEPVPEPKALKPKAGSEPDGFPEWYQAFPRHVGRDAARKAYGAVLRDRRATQAELLAGAIRYAAERRGQDQKYTKHPAAWLIAGRWADEPTASAGKPAATLVERESGQRKLVSRWRASPHSWPRNMGPRPDEPGCSIPKPILAEFGL